MSKKKDGPVHAKGCDGRLRVVPIHKGGGFKCRCGAKWECY